MSWFNPFLPMWSEAPDSSAPVVVRPKLRVVGKAPTREEFEAWRDHPISQMVFAGLSRAADEQRDEWTEASWGQGVPNAELLIELRTRADAYRALEQSTYEGWCETLGLEPESKA